MTRSSETTALALFLAALCAAAVGPAYVNHDAAWYLYMAHRWIEGASLYQAVIDTNPPLIIWLSSVPVWLATITGIGAPALFKVYVFMAAALSLVATGHIVRRAWPAAEFLLVSMAVFLCLPFVKGDFGQREHFALLLTLPYVVAAAAGEVMIGVRLRWIVGLAAGLGFAIKPHFVLAWIAVEAAACSMRGRQALRRPEAIGALISAVAYALAVVIVTPQYFALAGQVRQVYGGLDSDAGVLVRLREVQLWLVALALFAAIRWPAGVRLPTVLFAAATGYLAAALLQRKGWGYQLYPARVFILLFMATAIGAVLDALPSAMALLRGGRRGLGIVFAGALVVASTRYVAEARRPAAPDLVTPLIGAIQTQPLPRPAAVLSMRTLIYPAFPAVNYAQGAWSLRHNSLWFLPGLYADQDLRGGGPLQPHRLDSMPPLERLFFDQVVDDLCAAPPGLLMIERPAPAAPAGRRALDLQEYYGQSPRLRHLLSGYAAQGEIGPFTVFTAPAPRCP